jgi:hypothetical protein
MDAVDGIIIGVATAVVATIITNKYFNSAPVGGPDPRQPAVPSYDATSGGKPAMLYVVDLNPTAVYAAPIAQVNPITEAAYNQHPVAFEEAFGPAVNQPAEEAVLPQ